MEKKKYVVFVRKFDMIAQNENHTTTYGYIVETEDILHVLGEVYYTSLERIYRMDFYVYIDGIEKDYETVKFIKYKCKYPIGWNGEA